MDSNGTLIHGLWLDIATWSTMDRHNLLTMDSDTTMGNYNWLTMDNDML